MILHAVWTLDRLHLWGEDRRRLGACGDPAEIAVATQHPFAMVGPDLAEAVAPLLEVESLEPVEIALRLPCRNDGRLCPSARLLGVLGEDPPDDALLLRPVLVPALALPHDRAVPLLLRLEQAPPPGFSTGHDLRAWFALARLVAERLADQRVVPSLELDDAGRCEARWRPWHGDADSRQRLGWLASALPAASHCGLDSPSDPRAVLDLATAAFTDALVRRVLVEESFETSLEEWDPDVDPQVRWLGGLLGARSMLDLSEAQRFELPRQVRAWIARLEDGSAREHWRLHLRLREPIAADSIGAEWRVELGLAAPMVGDSSGDADRLFAASEIWSGRAHLPGGSGAELSEQLLTELAKASRIWTVLERALSESDPTEVRLRTSEAYALLREFRPVLEESGVLIEPPPWWGQTANRLGLRLHLDPIDATDPAPVGTGGAGRGVSYRWELVLGGDAISLDRFRAVAAEGTPLVAMDGRWVEIRPEDLAAATRVMKAGTEGRTTLAEAMRMAHALDLDPASERLPIAGVEASGWLGELLHHDPAERVRRIDPPQRFLGELRPYQQSGLSWLAFLDRLGMGGCLADDMGLGKTIQLIALLQHERERSAEALPGPTLIVAPMSVVGNWQRELGRFAPELRVHRHHGLDRPVGDEFVGICSGIDVVLTTYGLVARDLELLQRVRWHRVVLDEAQHVKNPPTKQASAIRALPCEQRVALTGTPVENRLGELWSILDFCCPGYLGSAGEFRRLFAVPIERHRDRAAADRLRQMVRPFILRRLKTDPTVISDLPPLVQSRQHVPLSAEQVGLYETAVAGMLRSVDEVDGMRRRGLVLAGLVRLKQICNHPAQFLGEELPEGGGVDAFATRSGKSARLLELCEEILSAGDRTLLFTQYRQMGHLLSAMLRRRFDIEPLFLHGGTPGGRREQLVERFQSGDPGCPIFILSLRAGGVGLNLTSANHVIHYDRWWNPAVENQATDRAFRIGQLRTVHVHRLICAGTLEDRIDQMIEQKTELAEQVVGDGESWLTELSTGQLQDLLQLRRHALDDAEFEDAELVP